MSDEKTDSWRPIKPLVGDGTEYAGGKVEMVRGTEMRPCLTCRSWERDQPKLIRHFKAHGLEQRPDGTFLSPIMRDFPGRKPIILDPTKMGFCRLETRATEDMATCEAWSACTLMSQLQTRLKR